MRLPWQILVEYRSSDESFHRWYGYHLLSSESSNLANCGFVAAQKFIDRYYRALNNSTERATLASFYIQPTPLSPLPADISLNGNIVQSPLDLQNIFLDTIPAAHYEVQSFDCHVLNTNYNIGANDTDFAPDATGRKMCIALIVSGYVKYGEARDTKMRGFTENFILVPNFQAGIGSPHDMKKWLIQSQNFRIVL